MVLNYVIVTLDAIPMGYAMDIGTLYLVAIFLSALMVGFKRSSGKIDLFFFFGLMTQGTSNCFSLEIGCIIFCLIFIDEVRYYRK